MWCVVRIVALQFFNNIKMIMNLIVKACNHLVTSFFYTFGVCADFAYDLDYTSCGAGKNGTPDFFSKSPLIFAEKLL